MYNGGINRFLKNLRLKSTTPMLPPGVPCETGTTRCLWQPCSQDSPTETFPDPNLDLNILPDALREMPATRTLQQPYLQDTETPPDPDLDAPDAPCKTPTAPPESKFGSCCSSHFRTTPYTKRTSGSSPRSAILILYKDWGSHGCSHCQRILNKLKRAVGFCHQDPHGPPLSV